MIDWISVFKNTFWILGLSGGLATLSMASYQSKIERQPIGKTLSARPFERVLLLSELLFAIGLAVTSVSTIEKIVWGGLSILLAIQCLIAHPPTSRKGKPHNKQ